jgi:hypothetical protein
MFSYRKITEQIFYIYQDKKKIGQLVWSEASNTFAFHFDQPMTDREKNELAYLIENHFRQEYQKELAKQYLK